MNEDVASSNAQGRDRAAGSFLAGGGEMGERIRAFDWARLGAHVSIGF